jgi:uncharacterized protein (TIGR03435 family)
MNYYAKPPNLRHFQARMGTLTDMLRLLDRDIGRPVVDKTGLTGRYDFNLDFVATATTIHTDPTAAPEPQSAPASPLEGVAEPGPELFAALESQLGLKLVSSKSPVKVLVVDKVNEKPTEN